MILRVRVLSLRPCLFVFSFVVFSLVILFPFVILCVSVLSSSPYLFVFPLVILVVRRDPASSGIFLRDPACPFSFVSLLVPFSCSFVPFVSFVFLLALDSFGIKFIHSFLKH